MPTFPSLVVYNNAYIKYECNVLSDESRHFTHEPTNILARVRFFFFGVCAAGYKDRRMRSKGRRVSRLAVPRGRRGRSVAQAGQQYITCFRGGGGVQYVQTQRNQAPAAMCAHRAGRSRRTGRTRQRLPRAQRRPHQRHRPQTAPTPPRTLQAGTH